MTTPTTAQQHTPGPWKVSDNDRLEPDQQPLFPGVRQVATNDLICDVFGDVEQVHANARRIVACVNGCEGITNPEAVKDLLEALKKAVLTIHSSFHVLRDGNKPTAKLVCECEEVQIEALAAIAKAAGRE